MTTFYLSNQYDVPATGLYHYTATQTPGEYEERRIRCNGQPGQPLHHGQLVSAYNPQSPPSHRDWHLYAYIDTSDWLEISPGPPATYLAFHRVAKGQPQRKWQNALHVNNNNTHQLALPPNTRWILPSVSGCRRQQGYEQVINKAAQGGASPALSDNAGLFWQAGKDVCGGIIDHLRYSLGSSPSSSNAYSSLSSFNQPDWVLQLNRVLSEGFIEGHAQPPFILTYSSTYQVGPNSAASWNTVLTRAEQDFTLADFLQLSPGEQHAMNILADAIIKRFNLSNIISGAPDAQRQTVLRWILDYFTPGSTHAQEFAFWHLHYPHWYIDLGYALQLYGAKPNNQDWDTLAQIIMMNYPLQGTGLSVNDWLLGVVLRLGGIMGMTFPDWITFMVEAVLRDVRQQNSTTLPCP